MSPKTGKMLENWKESDSFLCHYLTGIIFIGKPIRQAKRINFPPAFAMMQYLTYYNVKPPWYHTVVNEKSSSR